jgi:hypothetical protein
MMSTYRESILAGVQYTAKVKSVKFNLQDPKNQDFRKLVPPPSHATSLHPISKSGLTNLYQTVDRFSLFCTRNDGKAGDVGCSLSLRGPRPRKRVGLTWRNRVYLSFLPQVVHFSREIDDFPGNFSCTQWPSKYVLTENPVEISADKMSLYRAILCEYRENEWTDLGSTFCDPRGFAFFFVAARSRANMAHLRQSRPNSCPVFK